MHTLKISYLMIYIYGLDEEAPTSCEDYIGDIALSAPLVPLTSEMPQQLKLTIDSDIA